jgi:hypothetical protein
VIAVGKRRAVLNRGDRYAVLPYVRTWWLVRYVVGAAATFRAQAWPVGRFPAGSGWVAVCVLRADFDGRVSGPVSSRAWQVEAAGRVIAGRGQIVAEFFDVATSRSLPWARRAQAAALLSAAAGPGRGFDAVVVGEFERAFAGGEAPVVIAVLAGCGVQVWLPEARGPVDLAKPEHQALLMMLDINQNARSCVIGCARPRRWPRRSASRAEISAVGHRMATGLSTRVRTRRPCTPGGAAVGTALILTR